MLSLALLMLLAVAPSAWAAFPGRNGKIAFGQGGQVKVVNPNGTGETPLRAGFDPAWSADGRDIAFGIDADIWRMSQDGSSASRIWIGGFNDLGRGAAASRPAWAPDSQRLAAELLDCPDEICSHYVMTIDANTVSAGNRFPFDTGAEPAPAWSPDGTRIAFYASSGAQWVDLDDGLYTAKPDGTDARLVYSGACFACGDPLTIQDIDWSPDGTKIALSFSPVGTGGPFDIYVVSPTTHVGTRLTNNGSAEDKTPVWSPDGTQIAFSSNRDGDYEIWRMNADGSNPMKVTDNSVDDFAPNWQPIPINSYPRPKGATPMRVSLVVAFPECTAANKVHGPPLEYPSCGDNYNPPSGNSQHVTVGTPDWNGAPAKFVGSLRIAALVGNPATPADEADLRLQAAITDVRCRPVAAPATCGASNVVGADYVGELQARVALRITDKDNTPTPSGSGAATTIDMPYSFTIPCGETADDMIGSACDVDTTADALLPGAVKEGVRAIWQLGQVEVLDGGPDGDVDTPTGGQVFLRQGIFVP
jgi:hypothetical protein